MSTPEDLNDIYIDELKDLWSANDQMLKVLKKVTAKASDTALKDMLTKSHEGITAHTAVLKELIAGQDEKVSKEHCKGWRDWSPRRPSTCSRKALTRVPCSMS